MSLDAARKEAARIASHLELGDIRMWSVRADLSGLPDDDSHLTYRFNADVQVQHSAEHALVHVAGNYSVEVLSEARPEDAEEPSPEGVTPEGDSDPSDTDVIAEIAFNLAAIFVVEREPAEPFSESEVTAFGQTTGQFALHPFARQFVADLTGRMGLPTLHLGLMRINLESLDE